MTALHAAKYNRLGSNLEYNITAHHLIPKLSCYKSMCKGNSFPVASLAMSILQVFTRDPELRNEKLQMSTAVTTLQAPSHSA